MTCLKTLLVVCEQFSIQIPLIDSSEVPLTFFGHILVFIFFIFETSAQRKYVMLEVVVELEVT